MIFDNSIPNNAIANSELEHTVAQLDGLGSGEQAEIALTLPSFDGKTGMRLGIDACSNKSLRAAAGD